MWVSRDCAFIQGPILSCALECLLNLAPTQAFALKGLQQCLRQMGPWIIQDHGQTTQQERASCHETRPIPQAYPVSQMELNHSKATPQFKKLTHSHGFCNISLNQAQTHSQKWGWATCMTNREMSTKERVGKVTLSRAHQLLLDRCSSKTRLADIVTQISYTLPPAGPGPPGPLFWFLLARNLRGPCGDIKIIDTESSLHELDNFVQLLTVSHVKEPEIWEAVANRVAHLASVVWTNKAAGVDAQNEKKHKLMKLNQEQGDASAACDSSDMMCLQALARASVSVLSQLGMQPREGSGLPLVTLLCGQTQYGKNECNHESSIAHIVKTIQLCAHCSQNDPIAFSPAALLLTSLCNNQDHTQYLSSDQLLNLLDIMSSVPWTPHVALPLSSLLQSLQARLFGLEGVSTMTLDPTDPTMTSNNNQAELQQQHDVSRLAFLLSRFLLPIGSTVQGCDQSPSILFSHALRTMSVHRQPEHEVIAMTTHALGQVLAWVQPQLHRYSLKSVALLAQALAVFKRLPGPSFTVAVDEDRFMDQVIQQVRQQLKQNVNQCQIATTETANKSTANASLGGAGTLECLTHTACIATALYSLSDKAKCLLGDVRGMIIGWSRSMLYLVEDPAERSCKEGRSPLFHLQPTHDQQSPLLLPLLAAALHACPHHLVLEGLAPLAMKYRADWGPEFVAGMSEAIGHVAIVFQSGKQTLEAAMRDPGPTTHPLRHLRHESSSISDLLCSLMDYTEHCSFNLSPNQVLQLTICFLDACPLLTSAISKQLTHRALSEPLIQSVAAFDGPMIMSLIRLFAGEPGQGLLVKTLLNRLLQFPGPNAPWGISCDDIGEIMAMMVPALPRAKQSFTYGSHRVHQPSIKLHRKSPPGLPVPILVLHHDNHSEVLNNGIIGRVLAAAEIAIRQGRCLKYPSVLGQLAVQLSRHDELLDHIPNSSGFQGVSATNALNGLLSCLGDRAVSLLRSYPSFNVDSLPSTFLTSNNISTTHMPIDEVSSLLLLYSHVDPFDQKGMVAAAHVSSTKDLSINCNRPHGPLLDTVRHRDEGKFNHQLVKKEQSGNSLLISNLSNSRLNLLKATSLVLHDYKPALPLGQVLSLIEAQEGVRMPSKAARAALGRLASPPWMVMQMIMEDTSKKNMTEPVTGYQPSKSLIDASCEPIKVHPLKCLLGLFQCWDASKVIVKAKCSEWMWLESQAVQLLQRASDVAVGVQVAGWLRKLPASFYRRGKLKPAFPTDSDGSPIGQALLRRCIELSLQNPDTETLEQVFLITGVPSNPLLEWTPPELYHLQDLAWAKVQQELVHCKMAGLGGDNILVAKLPHLVVLMHVLRPAKLIGLHDAQIQLLNVVHKVADQMSPRQALDVLRHLPGACLGQRRQRSNRPLAESDPKFQSPGLPETADALVRQLLPICAQLPRDDVLEVLSSISACNKSQTRSVGRRKAVSAAELPYSSTHEPKTPISQLEDQLWNRLPHLSRSQLSKVAKLSADLPISRSFHDAVMSELISRSQTYPNPPQ